MKYKVLLLLMSLFIFVPGVNAQDNYYDYEVIELDSLPTASSETVNKLYKVNDKYYLGESISSEYTPLPLNEDLNGKTIYFDNSHFTYDYVISHINIPSSELRVFNTNTTFNNSFLFSKNNGRLDLYICGERYYIFSGIYSNNSSVVNQSCIISSIFSEVESKYFSLTPFETTYSFKEIDKSLVVPPVKDFYLFYKFEDIQEFKVLSVFDLSTFTDFEKLVVTLLFNILFLGFLGFCCYILLKFIYKGISMLFR